MKGQTIAHCPGRLVPEDPSRLPARLFPQRQASGYGAHFWSYGRAMAGLLSKATPLSDEN